jgi:hypothetical protein
MNLLGIFANHTNNIIKYNTCLNNISFLIKYLTNIVIVDSDNEKYSKKLYNDIKDNNKIINYFLIKNDMDYTKWIYALDNINYQDYDYIIFINDSIIITESLEEYFYSLNNISNNINLYGFSDSIKHSYHYESYLFSINKNIINNFINFFNTKKNLVYDYESYFYNIELNIYHFLDNDNNNNYKDCFLKIDKSLSRKYNKYILKLSEIFDFHENYKETIYGNNFNSFNYSFYKDNYNDVKNLNENELFNHFITIGQFEGRKYDKKVKTLLPDSYIKNLENIGLLYYFDIPESFDIYFYKKNNTKIENLSNIDTIFYFLNMDFYDDNNKNEYVNNFYINIYKKIFGVFCKLQTPVAQHSGQALLGAAEIELECINSINMNNIKDYLELNNLYIESSCLNQYNIGPIKIIEKYLLYLNNIDTNILEELTYNNNINISNEIPIDFDSNIYKFINKDLAHLNDEQSKNHYLEYGINELRLYKLPEDFNPVIYKFIYKDLSHFNDEQATNHYLEYGYHESRIYKLPENFDVAMYKFIYKDLSHFNDEEATNHYLEHGFHESRIYKLPDDFDVTMYKFIYKDLSNLNDEEATNHYLKHGEYESRIYKIPKKFNASIYKSLNKEISNLSDEEAKNHYLEVGIHEKLLFSE